MNENETLRLFLFFDRSIIHHRIEKTIIEVVTMMNSFHYYYWIEKLADEKKKKKQLFISFFFLNKTNSAMLTSSTVRLDPELEIKTRAVVRFINETLQYNANEPSLAFYRIQVK